MNFLSDEGLIAEYKRYSSHNQDDGFSIEYQTSEINDYCVKHGIKIDAHFVDEAKTGTTVAGRDAFYDLIRAVKDGKIKMIIVYKLSRIFRNSQESQYYRDMFLKKGVKLVSITEYVDDTTTSGRMTTNILSVLDQYQSEIISDHVKSSMREMARQGYHAGGSVLFGYTTEKIPHGSKFRRKYIPNDEEAEIVNKVFSMFANGKSLADIMHYLNDNGIRTRNGKLFSPVTVRQMLKNDGYIGVVRYKAKGYDEVVIPNARPAIISMTMWDAAQKMMKHQSKGQSRKRKFFYPLVNKMYCGCCGALYGGVTSTKRQDGKEYFTHGYVCNNRRSFQNCENTQINRNYIEPATINAIKKFILNEERINALSAEIANACNNIPTVSEEKTKQLKRSISDIEKQLDVLIEMRINGEISGEIIKKKSTPLEEMLESNRKELLRIQEQKRTTISFDDTKKYLTDMLQKMNTANEEGLKEIFNAFVENITINKDDVKIKLRVLPVNSYALKDIFGTPIISLSTEYNRKVKAGI